MKVFGKITLSILVSFSLLKSTAQVYDRPPEFAQKVYNDLFNAMSDTKTDKPKLLLEKNSKEVAIYDPKTQGYPAIILGDQFIDLVRDFGKDSSNALAHVLGHEMAHVFLHQNDISLVGSGYASVEINKKLKKIKNILRDSIFERQADEYAAFYCHIAGYKTTHVGELVLDSIYTRFKLNNKMLSKYPALEERKEIVRSSQKQMSVLKQMFDDGLLALVDGNYEMARAFFRTINKERFKSKEIFNNLGITFLMDAIDDLDTLEFPYSFPVQIDMITKLDEGNLRSISSDTKEKLEEALLNFNNAAGQNDYSLVWINKAVTEFLLSNYQDMEFSLQVAEKSSDQQLLEAARILRSIYMHKMGQVEDATIELKKLSSKSDLASRNLNKIAGKEWSNESNEILLPEKLKEIFQKPYPTHNFNSEYAKQGKKIIEPLGSRNDYSLRIGSDNEYDSRRWVYMYGNPQPRMDVYVCKQSIGINDSDWLGLKSISDIQFSSAGIEYVKVKSFVIKKEGNSIYLYHLK
jgi:hypothetical protein